MCPEIGRGNNWLKEFKQAYVGKEGSRAWTALYQGRPVAMEGNLIKKEWWKYYTCPWQELLLPYIIISVDATFKDGDNNDFVSVQVWGKRDNNYYLLTRTKKHLNFVDTLEVIRNYRREFPESMFVLVEDKANGPAIINMLSAEMEGLIPVKPEGGKVARVNAVLPAIEAGRVYLPKYADFTDAFIAECSAFPNGAHDDDVDAMSQALNRMIYVDADVISEVHKRYSHWHEDQIEDYLNADEELQTELIKLWGYPDNFDI